MPIPGREGTGSGPRRRPRYPGEGRPALGAGRPRRALLPACLTALTLGTACSDSPSGPPTEGLPLEIQVLSGAEQQGLQGLALPLDLLVRVVDPAGTPREGIPVHFTPGVNSGSAGLESATTDRSGLMQVEWVLGDASTRDQTMRISLSGEPGAAEVTVHARALRDDEVDVLVIRGAEGPLKGVLLLEELDEGRWLQIRQERVTPDTVIHLQPFDREDLRVLVFPTRNRLDLSNPAWTPGIDTVVVNLEPSVSVDAVVNVYRGTFSETRAMIEADMATTAQIWDENGAGIQWGDVEFADRTGREPVTVTSGTACQRSGEDTRLVIEYVTSIDSGGYWGYGCTTGIAYMGTGPQPGSALLAHELGHVFSLFHTAVGLMVPNPPGRSLTEGEIFRAHFNSSSALNTILGGQPEESRIPCAGGSNFRTCLAPDFRLGS